MSLGRLRAVLPPPSRPNETGGGASWSEIERRIGTALPADYKAFIAVYGTGRVDDFLVILNPFTANPYIDLVDHALNDPEGLAGLRRDHPGLYRFDRYPAPGGLMPFGVADNGDVFYWKTAGPAEGWTVVVCEARGPDCDEIALSMSDAVAALLIRTVRTRVLPPGFPTAHPAFHSG
jgi:hypothetical protein